MLLLVIFKYNYRMWKTTCKIAILLNFRSVKGGFKMCLKFKKVEDQFTAKRSPNPSYEESPLRSSHFEPS